ncbi:rsmH [Symbiodinium sp. CCMP2592]|nr:rsmH [Symbiodinium sp. CCMP2592]
MPIHTFPRAVPGQAPGAQPVPAEQQLDPGADVLHASFAVLILDHLPELVTVALRTPATVADAIQAVDEARDHDKSLQFSQLIEVRPQPFLHHGTLLALPDWCQGEPILCFDTTAIDGRLFTKSSPWRVTKAQLCRAAGLEGEQHVAVYAFGHPQPIAADEWIDVELGGCVFFTRPWEPARIGHMLPVMLRSPYGWESRPRLPEPVHARRFCLTLDRGHRLMHWPARSFGRSHHDIIAETFGLDSESLTVQASRPPVEDVALDGYPCITVAAVSDDISKVPIPPGRWIPPRHTVIIDARPLLMGFLLEHSVQGRINHSDLVDNLSVFVPEGYQVQLDGAPIDDAGEFLHVHPGHVLVATYVPLTSSEASSTDPSDSSDDDTNNEGEILGPGEHEAEVPASSSGGSNSSRSRSRTPPRDTPPRAHLSLTTGKLDVTADCSVARQLVFDTPTSPPASTGAQLVQTPPCGDKLLTEPACTTAAESARINALRRTAARLQEAWPYAVHPASFGIAPSESSTSSGVLSEQTAWATFAILVPGYSPELVTVALAFPTVFTEAKRAVQDARSPEAVMGFPILHPVMPQLFADLAVCIAVPEWQHRLPFLCLDLLGVDGRIFAVPAPQYLCLQDLLVLADLPADLGYDVFVGTDSLPLQPGVPVHVVTGQAITFLPAGSQPMHNLSIHEMLQDYRQWSPDAVLPERSQIGSYCLVHEDSHFLVTDSSDSRVSLRVRASAATGVRSDLLALVPASPRLSNVELTGCQCHTVIAACTQPARTPGDALLIIDCRPLLAGWRAILVAASRLDVYGLAEQISGTVDLTGTVSFLEIPFGVNVFQVTDGQVLTAALTPSQQAPTGHAPAGGSIAHPGESGSLRPSDPNEPPPDLASGNVDRITEPGRDPGPDSRQQLQGGYAGAVFLVLTPEYLPECIKLRLAPGQTPLAVLQAVAAARNPADSRRFQLLRQVPWQPASAFAVIIAVPTWSQNRVFVCFDCRQLDGRIFCLDVPASLTRQDILRLALLPDAADVVVYAADMPWPLLPGQRVDVSTGALIQIMTADHPHFTVVPFADWLQDSSGWNPRASLPGDFRDHTWILSDTGQFTFIVRRGRRHAIQTDLASQLAVDAGDLLLRIASPGVSNHMHRGKYTKGIIAVLATGVCAHPNTDGDLTCCPLRLLPTPCRATRHPPVNFWIGSDSSDESFDGDAIADSDDGLCPELAIAAYWPGPTLLQEALQQPGCPAFFLASTLLETLQEHQAERQQDIDASPGPQRISLVDCVPVSSHQAAALSLTALLPAPRSVDPLASGQDWLDADLRTLLRDPQVPDHLRAVPCNTPYHLLEEDDTALTGASSVPLRCQLQDRASSLLNFAPAFDNMPRLSLVLLTSMRADSKGSARIFPRTPDHVRRTFSPLVFECSAERETRLPHNGCQPDSDFHILQAAATDTGVGGCALWVARAIPYARCDGQDLFVEDRHLTVTAHSHRHLVVTVSAPRLLLQVSVIHAPSLANTPWEHVADFWRARISEIQGRPEGADFLLLTDANARVGTVASEHVGDHAWEPENESGTLFHDFLAQVQGFLPSTIASFHQGTSGTWCTPQGEWHRLDYVVLPCHWRDVDISSRVLVEVELMQKREDHLPVWVRCCFGKALPALQYFDNRLDWYVLAPRSWRCSRSSCYVTETGCTPGEDILEGLVHPQCEGLRVPSTPHHKRAFIDPVTHKQHIFLADAQALAEAFDPVVWTGDFTTHRLLHSPGSASVPGLAEAARSHPLPLPCSGESQLLTGKYRLIATLALVRVRQALRRYLSQEAQETHRRLQLIGFAAFVSLRRGLPFSQTAVARADFWLRAMDVSEASAAALLRWYGRQLRTAVARDRQHYLEGLVTNAAQVDLRSPKDLYKAIRKAFPAARAARRSGIVPLPALVLADGTMAATTEDRALGWRTHFSAQEAGEEVTTADYVYKVEQVVLRLKNGKSAGPEPVAWRGGNLMVLAKKACARLTCENYRSILVSCVPAKVYHRCLRAGLKPHLLSTQPSMQFRVRDGVGIETPALAVRSFAALLDGLRLPWAVLFVDLAAAFYTVVRQSLVPNPDTDQGFLSLLHALQLPPDAIEELHAHLLVASELPLQGVGVHQVELVRDLFVGSWFRLSTHSALILTHRGSRPGDPLADLLFAFTLAAYLRRVNQLLSDAGLMHSLPAPDRRPAWFDGPDSVTIGNPAWADDFTWPITAPSSDALVETAQVGTSILLSHASSIGMCLKFGPDKTALLLPETVKKNSERLLSVDDEGGLCLHVSDKCTGATCFLPLVSVYKHLGGVITSNSSPLPDLYHRFSRAEGTARPLRQVFFGSKQFTLTVRRALLGALVISKYTHTGAALIVRAACHMRVWERQYVRLWRNLFRRTAPEQQEHSLAVLFRASAVAPPLALAKSRAQFLSKLFSRGPLDLAALLVDHYLLHPASSWLDQLRADVAYAAIFLPDLRNVLAAGKEVAGLVEASRDNPQWWPQTLRRVEKLFFQDLQAWHTGHIARDAVSGVSVLAVLVANTSGTLLKSSSISSLPVEAPAKKRAKTVKAGCWRAFKPRAHPEDPLDHTAEMDFVRFYTALRQGESQVGFCCSEDRMSLDVDIPNR